MPLLTGFRLGRFVRVRHSSRGARLSIGPRAARLHVGGGKPGVSTGTGPFTWYQPIGSNAAGGKRRKAARKPDSAVPQPSPAASQTVVPEPGDTWLDAFPEQEPPYWR